MSSIIYFRYSGGNCFKRSGIGVAMERFANFKEDNSLASPPGTKSAAALIPAQVRSWNSCKSGEFLSGYLSKDN